LGSLLRAGVHSPAGTRGQGPRGKGAEREGLLSHAGLDEVKVLELENCPEEEDCWLYVSPRKSMDEKTASPLKWCRQVLDNPSPEIEAACRTLINRLDQGYLSMHSALSSQSSVDSELSTSDDSISMGYKLQDLTDVQVMARLQEESLRQDCASSSASVSRRSSSASLHSLRRGTYSDQEFDTYSLEDEDDCECSLSLRSGHRYSPSPLSSPRCQSPSAGAELARAAAPRLRAPRRPGHGPAQERLKYANSEEELRHSMPNLARSSLRALEAVRSSRSLESDLQVSASPRTALHALVPSRRPQRCSCVPAGVAPSKLRYSSGAPCPLAARQPGKASPAGSSLLPGRQVGKPCSYTAPAGPVRKAQLHTGSPSSSCTSRTSSVVTVAKASALKARPALGGAAAPRGKATPPCRRFLQAAQTPQSPEDDSWKDGCY
ncbi:SLAIL protein, partial [Spelaeornis formosus]|nr:SLAIL protein [Elachura formosa]